MDLNKKILIISMLVMLVCCVSAVSATDINGTDDISDDIIIDENPVDEITDVVEDVNIDDTQDNAVDEGNLRGNPLTVDTTTYTNYFDANGYFNDSSVTDLTFNGNFGSQSYGNFKFNQSITIGATSGSTFTDVGFDLLANGITLNGVNITMNAGNTSDCYVINIANSANSNVSDNIITYTCTHDNAAIYNYAIKAINSENLTIYNNVINAELPLKTVNWALSGSIAADYVAGVAIERCNKLHLTYNNITVIANGRVGSFPTLDAVIVSNSNNSFINNNRIIERDLVTVENDYSYVYGIDLYSCYNMTINKNSIIMNADNSGGHLVGGNGTGAAYCIQLTGPYNGVVISNNSLITKNNGPNAAIYSQNWNGPTNLTISGNSIDVTGKASSNSWDVVSGMELQDTYATVTGNTITVRNNGVFGINTNIYGVSYCQYTPGNHTFIITGNTITVLKAHYSVYIMNGVNCYIGGNTLRALYNYINYGNPSIYISGTNNTVGNNP